METAIFDKGSLVFALAMAAGMLCQGIARHASIPGIVLLLAAGVLLGPDVANVIRPAALGPALSAIVGFSVAIILFEGGLNLKIKLLRTQAKAIRRLVTWGAVVTALGAMGATYLIMGWSWQLSLLFGTLVIVTGPTVITPLLRRIRVKHNVATILEAEGIFIDAVGATIAVVALEIVLEPSGGAVSAGVLNIALRLGVGSLVGLAGGLILALLLRWRRVVPEGMENVLVLAFAVALFEISNLWMHESGISAAIVAGMVLGNARSHALEDLVAFKEQLTLLLIATLFVLLAADVRVSDVMALGWPGLGTVLALMLVVRPLNVWLCTYRTGLDLREKLFLSWLAPRGIVAAAVSSLFAMELARANIEGGVQMKALVFLVIATTVTVQGLSGGLVAQVLGVRRKQRTGFLILGANPLALLVGKSLRAAGEEVVAIDANADDCRLAEDMGQKVFFGNALEDKMLLRAHADSREACLAITPNESVNLLFSQRVQRNYAGPDLFVALQSSGSGVTPDMVDKVPAEILFGGERDLQLWLALLRRRQCLVLRCRYAQLPKVVPRLDDEQARCVLPLVGLHKGKAFPLTDLARLRVGNLAEFAVDREQVATAQVWLKSAGFEILSEEE